MGKGRGERKKGPKKDRKWGGGERERERSVRYILCVSSLSECAYNTISEKSQRFGLNYR